MKIECMHCNKEFDAVRDIAKYCSDSCRTSAYKQRKKYEIANASLEKQRILEQERLQLIADEKRSIKEQKTELQRQEKQKRDEIVLKEREAKRLQDEQDEADLAKLNREKEEEQRQKEKNDQLMKAQKALQDSIKAKQNKAREMEESNKRSKLFIGSILIGAAVLNKVCELIFSPSQPGNSSGPDELKRPETDQISLNQPNQG